MRSSLLVAVALLALLGACRSRAPAAYGDANVIIVVATDSVWNPVEDTVRAALEPRVFTVRQERAFRVTRTAPGAEGWRDLRKFRNVMLVGRAVDPWMEPALGGETILPEALPVVVERRGIWANGQTVTAVVLADDDTGGQIRTLLPAIARMVDSHFRSYVRQRMFASGANAALRDTLRATAGFSITLPNVYSQRTVDSTYVFQNAYPDPGKLLRSVLVTWRTGSADDVRAQDLLGWRDALATAHYELFDPVTERDDVRSRPLELDGPTGLEVQGIWSTSSGEWPAAGPFISRVVPCPDQDRLYLLDAWLFAPGKDKYEYMLQLETILNSFACDGAPAPARRVSAAAAAARRGGAP